MALTKGQKIGIAVAAGAAILLLTGAANAADLPDVLPDDDLPPPPPPPDDDFDHIPRTARKRCNYVGCNEVIPNAPTFVWQHIAEYPTAQSLIYALRTLGYMVDPARSIIAKINFDAAKQFQRDYNVGRVMQTVDPTPPSLATEGLVGNQTIAAIINANRWVAEIGLPWSEIVANG